MRPVFPLSMSDFKPGDKEYCVQDETLADTPEKGTCVPLPTASAVSCNALRLCRRTPYRTRTLDYPASIRFFLRANRNTRQSV